MKTILAVHLTPPSDALARLSESLLILSPLVVPRSPDWIFVDVTRTLDVLGGVVGVRARLRGLLTLLDLQASWAFHHTSATAQMLALSPPGSSLASLPIHFLLFAEGTKAFEDFEKRQVRSLIENLPALGFKTVHDFTHLSDDAIGERWGELGYRLKRACLGVDSESFDVYEPPPVFSERVAFDFPCSLVSQILEQIDSVLQKIECRLLGRGAWAHEMTLVLEHEYSRARETITIRAAHPSSEATLWLKLFKQKLDRLNLENPLRELRIEAQSLPRQSRQLSLLNDEVESTQEKLLPVLNFLSEAFGSQNVGFAHLDNSLLPERAWHMEALPETTTTGSLSQRRTASAHGEASTHASAGAHPFLSAAPRPTVLFETPIPIENLSGFHFLHVQSERIQCQWWNPVDNCQRDYYVVQKDGRFLWIYRDLATREFFVHGAFD